MLGELEWRLEVSHLQLGILSWSPLAVQSYLREASGFPDTYASADFVRLNRHPNAGTEMRALSGRWIEFAGALMVPADA